MRHFTIYDEMLGDYLHFESLEEMEWEAERCKQIASFIEEYAQSFRSECDEDYSATETYLASRKGVEL